jgi:hypothetical protein
MFSSRFFNPAGRYGIVPPPTITLWPAGIANIAPNCQNGVAAAE